MNEKQDFPLECVGRCDATCPNIRCYNAKSWVIVPVSRETILANPDAWRQGRLELDWVAK